MGKKMLLLALENAGQCQKFLSNAGPIEYRFPWVKLCPASLLWVTAL